MGQTTFANGRGIAAAFMLGASAVQVGTANFIDPFIWGKLLDGMRDYMTRHGIARFSDLVGSFNKEEAAWTHS